jgi:hypothetical protein
MDHKSLMLPFMLGVHNQAILDCKLSLIEDTTRTHVKEFEAFYVNTYTTGLPSSK